MDQRERQVIDELFGKLRQVERQAPQRDADAEAHIRQQVSGLPAAPYYMAQAILVQEQALANMQTRVQELERQLAERPAGGGFLSGLFGGDPQQTAPAPQRPMAPVHHGMTPPGIGAGYGSPWGRGQVVAFLPVPCRRRLAWPAACSWPTRSRAPSPVARKP